MASAAGAWILATPRPTVRTELATRAGSEQRHSIWSSLMPSPWRLPGPARVTQAAARIPMTAPAVERFATRIRWEALRWGDLIRIGSMQAD